MKLLYTVNYCLIHKTKKNHENIRRISIHTYALIKKEVGRCANICQPDIKHNVFQTLSKI